MLRDKTPEKSIAYREFTYIYFMCDYQSPVLSLHNTDKKRHAESRILAGFENTWSVDEKVEAAMNTYRKLQMTPSLKLLEQIRATINSSTNILEFIGEGIDDKLVILKKLQKATAQLTNMTPSNVADYSRSLKEAFDLIIQMQNLSISLPKILDNVDSMEKKVRAEMSDKRLAAGKRQVGNREDSEYLNNMDGRPSEMK